MNFENHLKRQLERIENETTRILVNHIKTYDLAFVTLSLLNQLDLREMSSEKGAWLIDKNPKAEDLYKRYKDKETLVEPVSFANTLLNLVSQK
jgi:uncharacterized protein (DUF2225 family)